VWLWAEGFADLGKRSPATTNTTFAVASLSKLLTAAVVMRLVELGKINLHRDVRDYLPSFPRKAFPITMRQLLSHQSGIRSYRFGFLPAMFSEFGSNKQYRSVGESMAIFAEDPLVFEPDTDFLYTPFGFTLASAVVESVTGRSFLDVMQEQLFAPLGMRATSADDKLHPPPTRATDYQNWLPDQHVVQAPPTNSSNKWAGGGFRSNPKDLALFGIALMQERIVSRETLDLMLTRRKLRSGKPNPDGYGLGFRTGRMSDASDAIDRARIGYHTGNGVGSRAVFLMLPDEKFVVVILANGTTSHGQLLFDAACDLARLIAKDNATAHAS